MTSRADRFALHFAILFLSILLSMFALFHLMRADNGYHYGDSWWLSTLLGKPKDPGAMLDFTEAFRVNLFLIDLSLLLVIESVLIFLFIRFTVPALLISCIGVLGVMGFGRGLLENERIAGVLLLLARTPYARLGMQDAVLLFALNALLVSFLVAMMHHYRVLELQERFGTVPGKLPGDVPSPAPAAVDVVKKPEEPFAAPPIR